jgi:hypothetical protein
VADDSWPRDPLDQFILRRLEDEGLSPARPASRLAWLRRITFDVTGLPPSRRDAEAFLADEAPDAAAHVVDRLLASEAFGECCRNTGSIWSATGLERSRTGLDIPYAWRYRDYVIRAFNANVPYDQFVREHIAGDLVDPPRIDPATRTNQSIQGTGFWHLGEATHSPVDIRGDEADRIANSLDVFGKAFLGMTVACARCHDHKFDAISKKDYYALCGFLESSGLQLADVADPQGQREVAEQLANLNATAARELFAAYVAMTRPRLQTFAVELATALVDDSATAVSVPDDRRSLIGKLNCRRLEATSSTHCTSLRHLTAGSALADQASPPCTSRRPLSHPASRNLPATTTTG